MEMASRRQGYLATGCEGKCQFIKGLVSSWRRLRLFNGAHETAVTQLLGTDPRQRYEAQSREGILIGSSRYLLPVCLRKFMDRLTNKHQTCELGEHLLETGRQTCRQTAREKTVGLTDWSLVRQTSRLEERQTDRQRKIQQVGRFTDRRMERSKDE